MEIQRYSANEIRALRSQVAPTVPSVQFVEGIPPTQPASAAAAEYTDYSTEYTETEYTAASEFPPVSSSSDMNMQTPFIEGETWKDVLEMAQRYREKTGVDLLGKYQLVDSERAPDLAYEADEQFGDFNDSDVDDAVDDDDDDDDDEFRQYGYDAEDAEDEQRTEDAGDDEWAIRVEDLPADLDYANRHRSNTGNTGNVGNGGSSIERAAEYMEYYYSEDRDRISPKMDSHNQDQERALQAYLSDSTNPSEDAYPEELTYAQVQRQQGPGTGSARNSAQHSVDCSLYSTDHSNESDSDALSAGILSDDEYGPSPGGAMTYAKNVFISRHAGDRGKRIIADILSAHVLGAEAWEVKAEKENDDERLHGGDMEAWEVKVEQEEREEERHRGRQHSKVSNGKISKGVVFAQQEIEGQLVLEALEAEENELDTTLPSQISLSEFINKHDGSESDASGAGIGGFQDYDYDNNDMSGNALNDTQAAVGTCDPSDSILSRSRGGESSAEQTPSKSFSLLNELNDTAAAVIMPLEGEEEEEDSGDDDELPSWARVGGPSKEIPTWNGLSEVFYDEEDDEDDEEEEEEEEEEDNWDAYMQNDESGLALGLSYVPPKPALLSFDGRTTDALLAEQTSASKVFTNMFQQNKQGQQNQQRQQNQQSSDRKSRYIVSEEGQNETSAAALYDINSGGSSSGEEVEDYYDDDGFIFENEQWLALGSDKINKTNKTNIAPVASQGNPSSSFAFAEEENQEQEEEQEDEEDQHIHPSNHPAYVPPVLPNVRINPADIPDTIAIAHAAEFSDDSVGPIAGPTPSYGRTSPSIIRKNPVLDAQIARSLLEVQMQVSLSSRDVLLLILE